MVTVWRIDLEDFDYYFNDFDYYYLNYFFYSFIDFDYFDYADDKKDCLQTLWTLKWGNWSFENSLDCNNFYYTVVFPYCFVLHSWWLFSKIDVVFLIFGIYSRLIVLSVNLACLFYFVEGIICYI